MVRLRRREGKRREEEGEDELSGVRGEIVRLGRKMGKGKEEGEEN